jgi:hypothetical protein
MFSGQDPLLIELLVNMLKFNPSSRFTADQCLKSPIFDKIRNFSHMDEVDKETTPLECVDDFKSRNEAAEYFLK